MCGIIGACTATNFIDSEWRTIQRLLFLSHFRGSDSTGYFIHTRNPTQGKSSIYYKKTLQHPVIFALDNFASFVKENGDSLKSSTVCFHTRYATKGSVTIGNAHPFNTKNVVGVHNGTIHSGLLYDSKFDTDSEALYNQISDFGLEETIKDLPSTAAYALVFIDKSQQNKTLNFLRNYARPLHVCRKAGVLYWASEGRDLQNALDIQGEIKALPSEEGAVSFEDGKVYSFPVGYLYSKDLSRASLDLTCKKMEVKAYTSNFTSQATQNLTRIGYMGGTAVDNPPWQSAVYKREETDKGGVALRARGKFCKKRYISSGPMFSHLPTFAAYSGVVTGFNPEVLPSPDSVWAIELGGWIPEDTYKHLCVLRACFPEEFLKAARAEYLGEDRKGRSEIADVLGISNNQIKKILRSVTTRAFKNYVEKPTYYKPSFELVVSLDYFDRIPFESAKSSIIDRRNMASRHAATTTKAAGLFDSVRKELNAVIDRSESTTERVADETYKVGLYNIEVDHEEWLTKTKGGCCNCSEAPIETDDIFWISDNDFLCEYCQEDVVKNVKPYEAFTHWRPAIRQHVADRAVRESKKSDIVYFNH